MLGTPNQVEWAQQIKTRISGEFDRVSKALTQAAGNRPDFKAMIAILEEKRAEVMAKDQAGYYIREWQEMTDQVRTMINQDPRFQAIKSKLSSHR